MSHESVTTEIGLRQAHGRDFQASGEVLSSCTPFQKRTRDERIFQNYPLPGPVNSGPRAGPLAMIFITSLLSRRRRTPSS